MTFMLVKDSVQVEFTPDGDGVKVYASNYKRRCYNETSCVLAGVGLYNESRRYSLEEGRKMYRAALDAGYTPR